MEEARLAGEERRQRLASAPAAAPAVLEEAAAQVVAADDDDDEQLDAVVGALDELRRWREGTSAKARALGMALAAAPGLSAAVVAQLAAANLATSTASVSSSAGSSAELLPDALRQSFEAVLGETGRVLQLAEHQIVETVQRAALSARELGDSGHSSTLP